MILINGFLTGLSVGVFCIGICLPVFIPVLLSSRKDLKTSFLVIVQFSIGRLIGYVLFGFLVGYLGVKVESKLVHYIVNFSTIFLALIMIVHSIGFLKFGPKVCAVKFSKLKIPIILGFLTGINVCPPFLLSLSYIFNLQSIVKGMIYFLAFFVGTSVYIVPLGLLGAVSANKKLQKVAQVAGVIVGVIYLLEAFGMFFKSPL